MNLENLAIVKTNDLPIRHEGEVHDGKVRSVYWLNPEDSQRIIQEKSYPVHLTTPIGAMVISDRLSAFDCIWQAEEELGGIPEKGASLNNISKHWFNLFDEAGLAGNHILDIPHPLVWIVQRADPILVEAVARQYITGSMWRAYEKGERTFCGIELPEELQKSQRLNKLLITPTTKGIIRGVKGIPEKEDADLTKRLIVKNYAALGFLSREDVNDYEKLLVKGFKIIEQELARMGKIFVDTKFEFGYINMPNGSVAMGYIDEIGTPDSSRFWDADEYAKGNVVEESKEGFRQFLLNESGIDPDILLNKKRMDERKKVAADYRVPVKIFMEVSDTYTKTAADITGKPVPNIENPREEIIDTLTGYGIIKY